MDNKDLTILNLDGKIIIDRTEYKKLIKQNKMFQTMVREFEIDNKELAFAA